MIKFPNKKYKIILSDPPWSYNDKMHGDSFSLEHEYETQDLEWIKALPVNGIAKKDCVLFLWVVNPLLPEAFEVIKAWGFKYKTVAFCWHKVTNKGTWINNPGRWTRGNMELCLLAVKGKPKRINKTIRQQVISERKNHSQKPDIIRKRIIELMGDISRIELFARGDRTRDLFDYNKFDGWDTWGNEAPDK